MSKRLKYSIIAVVAVLFSVALAFASIYFIDNKKANFNREFVLFVRPEMSSEQIISTLRDSGVVNNERSLKRCFDKLDVSGKLKPGKYVIEPSQPSVYVARMIIFGWQSPHNLTISGTIRSKEKLAQKIAYQMMADSAEVADKLYDERYLAQFGFTPENVFAMILPDTYQMYWTDSVDDIFKRLKKEYDIFWNAERLNRAKSMRMTPMQVSIMASIVSGETLKTFEYPRIAGVYLNRYYKGMKLQADPTVCFCFNYELDRVLRKHLLVDSPYNTYKYVGLPPAPINVPSKACVDAVLNAENHNYLYFCASEQFDGTHRFASTYSEHLKNARKFQRALTIRRKAQAE